MEDLFTNSSNSTLDVHHPAFYVQIINIFATSMAIGGVASNIIIIYTLIKFQKPNVHYNIYIASWCACNALLIVAFRSNFITHVVQCVTVYFTFVFMLGNTIFVSILVLDWYVTNYLSQNSATICRKSSKFVTLVIWIVIVVFVMNSLFFCFYKIHVPYILLLVLIGTLFAIVVIIGIHVLRLIKWKTSSVIIVKSNLVLILVSSYLLCWLPKWVRVCHLLIFEEYHTYDGLGELTTGIAFSNSVVVLFLLYCCDETFKKSLGRMCKCKEENSVVGGDHRDIMDLRETADNVLIATSA
jgi:hypothetical protein